MTTGLPRHVHPSADEEGGEGSGFVPGGSASRFGFGSTPVGRPACERMRRRQAEHRTTLRRTAALHTAEAAAEHDEREGYVARILPDGTETGSWSSTDTSSSSTAR